MKLVCLKWIACLAVVATVWPAHAQMGHRHMRDGTPSNDQAAARPASDQLRQDLRSGEAPPPDRMSPEERRQLRRDIDDAGRDIYRRRSPRPPAQ